MMKHLLIQTQLSNYDTHGKFIIECDSGFQMVMGRVREMLKLNPDLDITVMGPLAPQKADEGASGQLVTHYHDVNPDLWRKYGVEGENRLHYLEHYIIPNALATRYDFNFDNLGRLLKLAEQKAGTESRYDAVYINDPLHLRNFKALFHLKAGYNPRFYVHSHFVDVPSCPKFPEEASLWFGQCEAAIKADFNFWQCESALKEFEHEARKVFTSDVVDAIMAKSMPWDDGYSQEEITTPVDSNKLRFSLDEFQEKVGDKAIIFVPNRIGGKGRSSDYTNCGKFMFELLPELRKHRQDFVIVCGNPSQKFLNSELEEMCGKDGYISLVPDAFTRDEFKFVASHSHVALGLYDQDTYGGTAARECIELGCTPLWLDVNEYSSIAKEAGGYPFVVKPDWSDFQQKLRHLISVCRDDVPIRQDDDKRTKKDWLEALQLVVRRRCSYESTTPEAMKIMDLL